MHNQPARLHREGVMHVDGIGVGLINVVRQRLNVGFEAHQLRRVLIHRPELGLNDGQALLHAVHYLDQRYHLL